MTECGNIFGYDITAVYAGFPLNSGRSAGRFRYRYKITVFVNFGNNRVGRGNRSGRFRLGVSLGCRLVFIFNNCPVFQV